MLFITLYKVVITFNRNARLMKAEEYFPVALFIMLYKVVLRFVSVDEILMCDHSIESC